MKRDEKYMVAMKNSSKYIWLDTILLRKANFQELKLFRQRSKLFSSIFQIKIIKIYKIQLLEMSRIFFFLKYGSNVYIK